MAREIEETVRDMLRKLYTGEEEGSPLRALWSGFGYRSSLRLTPGSEPEFKEEFKSLQAIYDHIKGLHGRVTGLGVDTETIRRMVEEHGCTVRRVGEGEFERIEFTCPVKKTTTEEEKTKIKELIERIKREVGYER